ncbi:beta-glucosidase family protein [Subtercola frigoramans]|uniref:Beta-glucosidase n=1 Tax=Subtercola frigoramans TaxID=120298 RepID=A0ABS2L7P6_9MICO|nr:glycoside hydrolase family 3 C-terminal domain-containing protein [Subtercola frigoramans]MBM7473102.1 beta-glucosidase [Subtercola frigoramans]
MSKGEPAHRPLPSVEQLTSLTTGVDYWTSAALPSHRVRSLRMADGPHGLRVQDDANPDHLGLERSAPATCFPPAVTVASSWDTGLIREIGRALGREAKAAGVDVVLGPGLNIKRSPLCGRNFEYYSEDPLLAGVLAAAAVNGLQSAAVAACAKHFAANNQETDRMRVSAEIDQSAIREIYLRAFQIMLRESTPWSIMSAYNKINGVYASENHWLLTEVLRSEWGYEGVVISDWGAVHDPVEAVNAGLDLRMPGQPSDARVPEAAASGTVSRSRLDDVAARLRRLGELTAPPVDGPGIDYDEHHRLVHRAAIDSAVLLKNDGILPLDDSVVQNVAVIGELARSPRYQGAGSSRVNAISVTTGLQALASRIEAAGGTVTFAAGYPLDSDEPDARLIADAVETARQADVTLVFLGLPDAHESEGQDRTSIELPIVQLELLDALAGLELPLVVILSNGAVVTTASWKGDVSAILEMWLTGQAHGEAVADVLFGAEPGGRLAETIPVRLSDTPAYLSFPGEESVVVYGESTFVGYRYYDARSIPVDHPFGFGLSYTTFRHDAHDIRVHPVDDPIAFTVDVTVTNLGKRIGSEVVQVYAGGRGVAGAASHELKGWAKVQLQPGAQEVVHIQVQRDDVSRWSRALQRRVPLVGQLAIFVGSNSRDLPFSARVDLPGVAERIPLNGLSTLGEFTSHPSVGPLLDELVQSRGGYGSRIGDLLTEEAGRVNVLAIPISTLVDLPGVPYAADDVEQLLSAQ